jgi:hypothetical protein
MSEHIIHFQVFAAFAESGGMEESLEFDAGSAFLFAFHSMR